jgi:hypothetical protein
MNDRERWKRGIEPWNACDLMLIGYVVMMFGALLLVMCL